MDKKSADKKAEKSMGKKVKSTAKEEKSKLASKPSTKKVELRMTKAKSEKAEKKPEKKADMKPDKKAEKKPDKKAEKKAGKSEPAKNDPANGKGRKLATLSDDNPAPEKMPRRGESSVITALALPSQLSRVDFHAGASEIAKNFTDPSWHRSADVPTDSVTGMPTSIMCQHCNEFFPAADKIAIVIHSDGSMSLLCAVCAKSFRAYRNRDDSPLGVVTAPGSLMDFTWTRVRGASTLVPSTLESSTLVPSTLVPSTLVPSTLVPSTLESSTEPRPVALETTPSDMPSTEGTVAASLATDTKEAVDATTNGATIAALTFGACAASDACAATGACAASGASAASVATTTGTEVAVDAPISVDEVITSVDQDLTTVSFVHTTASDNKGVDAANDMSTGDLRGPESD